jgi:hypothetical protein
MNRYFRSPFFTAIVRIALGYLLGRVLYVIGRMLLRGIGILFFLWILGCIGR